MPDKIAIVNNGRQPIESLCLANVKFDVFTPKENLGVAASWNWFLANLEGDKVICNDDVEFAPDSLAILQAQKEGLVISAEAGFSCFLLREKLVEQIGYFDEELSPGYGYYEDEDYHVRVIQANIGYCVAECGVKHLKSMTLRAADHDETLDHHRRFVLAGRNFLKKWGDDPQIVKDKAAAAHGNARRARWVTKEVVQ